MPEAKAEAEESPTPVIEMGPGLLEARVEALEREVAALRALLAPRIEPRDEPAPAVAAAPVTVAASAPQVPPPLGTSPITPPPVATPAATPAAAVESGQPPSEVPNAPSEPQQQVSASPSAPVSKEPLVNEPAKQSMREPARESLREKASQSATGPDSDEPFPPFFRRAVQSEPSPPIEMPRPREDTPFQQMVRILGEVRGGAVEIRAESRDPAAVQYGRWLATVFNAAGWTVEAIDVQPLPADQTHFSLITSVGFPVPRLLGGMHRAFGAVGVSLMMGIDPARKSPAPLLIVPKRPEEP